jgi:hypothetical protein
MLFCKYKKADKMKCADNLIFMQKQNFCYSILKLYIQYFLKQYSSKNLYIIIRGSACDNFPMLSHLLVGARSSMWDEKA